MTTLPILRRAGIVWGALVAGLLLLTLFFLYRYGHPLVLLLPVGLLLPPLLGWRILTSPVLVISVFLFVIVNLDFFRFGGRVTLDILVSAVFLWGLIVRLGLSGRFAWRSAIEKAYLLYLATTLISVIVSVSPGASFKNWARDVEYLAILTFFLGYALTQKERRMLTGAILAASIIPCVAGFLGMVFGIPRLYGLPTITDDGAYLNRLYGTLSHPVTTAHYLGLLCTLTFGLLLDGRWFRRRFLLPLLALQSGALYYTYGRTGWIEFAIGAVMILWMRGKRKLLLLSVPIIVMGLVKFVPTFTERWSTAFTQSHENSFLFRLQLWAYALTLVPQRPLFGSGQDTFIQYVDYQKGYAAHQTAMNLLVETGVLGLLCFTVVIVLAARAVLKRLPWEKTEDPLLIPVIACWATQIVGSIAGDPFGLPAVAVYLWSLLGLVLAPRRRDAAVPAAGTAGG